MVQGCGSLSVRWALGTGHGQFPFLCRGPAALLSLLLDSARRSLFLSRLFLPDLWPPLQVLLLLTPFPVSSPVLHPGIGLTSPWEVTLPELPRPLPSQSCDWPLAGVGGFPINKAPQNLLSQSSTLPEMLRPHFLHL